MVHINYLKKDPTTKIKTKTLKQLKVLKDNEFIDNRLYYCLKRTDSPGQKKRKKQEENKETEKELWSKLSALNKEFKDIWEHKNS